MKTIRDFDLQNKKVIIRVDFNVPIKDGVIEDDTRIKESLETIKYAIEHNAKVILFSHLGRVKTEEDKIKNTLEPVALRLSELLEQEVIFVDEAEGSVLEGAISDLKPREVLLMENTRYQDLQGKRESNNDPILGKYWASLGEIFINDAFGTCHRSHASNVGIASNLPSGIGFLIEKELKYLEISHLNHPITVVLGGAKVSDKIKVIENLASKVDYILIGGGMAYTFLKASGIEVGNSLLDRESIDFCKDMLEKYEDKIILPIDSVNAKDIKEKVGIRECFINEIKEDEIGLDIGYNTIKLFKTYLENSKTIIWNGPVGMFELKPFDKGTIGLCQVLKELDANKIIGGGDTASAIINLGFKDSMNHISTGGGASLELLEGKELPGIRVISEKL